MAIYKDFQRNVYVNNSYIGIQKDETRSYFNLQFPGKVYLNYFPSGESGTFQLYAGFGINGVYEYLKSYRTNSYNSFADTMHLKHWSCVPVGTFGISRFVEGENVTCQFSFEYSLSINPDNHSISFPSDNIRYSHVISMRWSILR